MKKNDEGFMQVTLQFRNPGELTVHKLSVEIKIRDRIDARNPLVNSPVYQEAVLCLTDQLKLCSLILERDGS